MKKTIYFYLLIPMGLTAQINPYMNTIQNTGYQNSALGGFNKVLGTTVSSQLTAGCLASGYSNLINYSTYSGSPASNSSHAFGEHNVAAGMASFAIGQRVIVGTNEFDMNFPAANTFYNNSIAIGKDIKVYAENAMAIGSGKYSSNHSLDLVNTIPNSLVMGFNNTSTTQPTFFLREPNTTNASIYDNFGSIGIGTNDTKGHTLGVRGDIIAEKIQVATYSNWPDFVFEKNYTLTPLQNIEEYILTYKHLPEVPDAETIKTEGYDFAEMDAILLKKIEELTLYMIEMKKENEELKLLLKH